MAGDKSKRDKRDRNRVVGDEGYEIQYLVQKTGISTEQARALVHRFGNDREKLMEEARKLT
ncbi:DUF3606 domain-containing protein [Pseudaminobacter arsenicus]|uniref:DUF3606 domain-containing protein n=1 Tax=Borborobacter arsenicus TaxID=1851146 RepID=A0A432V0C5_9HYPH|nr:DUF3606 domain-containing protein [Pseudaminobacter arsenicus]RUM95633.1 DUF3606 domain-containing protein [Pseudaminobacter arsenicus]